MTPSYVMSNKRMNALIVVYVGYLGSAKNI